MMHVNLLEDSKDRYTETLDRKLRNARIRRGFKVALLALVIAMLIVLSHRLYDRVIKPFFQTRPAVVNTNTKKPVAKKPATGRKQTAKKPTANKPSGKSVQGK